MEIFLTVQLSGEVVEETVEDVDTWGALCRRVAAQIGVEEDYIEILPDYSTAAKAPDREELVCGAEVHSGTSFLVHNTSKYYLEFLAKGKIELSDCPGWVKADREICTMAVLKSATAWHEVDSSLKRDRSFMEDVATRSTGYPVSLEGYAVPFQGGRATGRMFVVLDQADASIVDREFCEHLVLLEPQLLKHIRKEFVTERFVLKLVELHPYDGLLAFVDPIILADPSFGLAVCSFAGRALSFLPESAKRDPQIVKAAVKNCSGALGLADPRFHQDWAMLKSAVCHDRVYVRGFPDASKEVLANQKFLLYCLEPEDGVMPNIDFIDAVRRDLGVKYGKNFPKEATRRNGEVLRWLPQSRWDEQCVIAAVRSCGTSLRYAAQNGTADYMLNSHKQICLAAVSQNPESARFIHPTQRRNIICAWDILRASPTTVRYLSGALASCRELAFYALHEAHAPWIHVPYHRDNATFMLNNIAVSYSSYRHAAPTLRQSKRFFYTAHNVSPQLKAALLASPERVENGEEREKEDATEKRLPYQIYRLARSLRIPPRFVFRLRQGREEEEEEEGEEGEDGEGGGEGLKMLPYEKFGKFRASAHPKAAWKGG